MLRSNLIHAGRALAAVLLFTVMAFTSVLVAPSTLARASADKDTAVLPSLWSGRLGSFAGSDSRIGLSWCSGGNDGRRCPGGL